MGALRTRTPAGAAVSDKVAALVMAVTSLDCNPEWVMRIYLEAAFDAENRSMSATARRLGMHRRTLQRILGKTRPPQYRRLVQFE